MKTHTKNTSNAKRDAIVLLVVAFLIWLLALATDTYEVVHQFLNEHEEWELDELMMALLCLGISGHIYSVLRLKELLRETRAKTLAENRARWIAHHDFLTKLPNRRFLEEKAPELIQSSFGADGYIVFAVDLDGFKKVNDLIGHDGGDRLLVEISRRLTEVFPDDIIARLGGDEFLVISEDRSEEDAETVCNKLICRLAEPVQIGNIHAEVGASVGYARAPEHGRVLKDLVQCADVALYAAKNRGRNTFVAFTPDMNRQLAERAEIEAELRLALESGRITPHYQPLIDLQTGELRGFEALARWESDAHGHISPEVFIAMAEDIGLILELSDKLLRQACQDALDWPSDLTLAFNISPTMIVDRLLGLRLIKVLQETGFPPNRLEVELTESTLVRDLDFATTVIQDLRSAGIRVALDDFGTGYSSLSQLSKLSFDKIKIDRAFIESFESDEKQMKIVKTMVALGQGLGISTTAEGIEEASQLALLKELGCAYGQGFLFGRAVPASKAAELAARRKAPELRTTA